MNRRRFLESTMLGGAAAAGIAANARAFSVQSCGAGAEQELCQEVAFHKRLLDDLKREIEKRHLPAEQARAVLARAVCPICGAPLIG